MIIINKNDTLKYVKENSTKNPYAGISAKFFAKVVDIEIKMDKKGEGKKMFVFTMKPFKCIENKPEAIAATKEKGTIKSFYIYYSPTPIMSKDGKDMTKFALEKLFDLLDKYNIAYADANGNVDLDTLENAVMKLKRHVFLINVKPNEDEPQYSNVVINKLYNGKEKLLTNYLLNDIVVLGEAEIAVDIIEKLKNVVLMEDAKVKNNVGQKSTTPYQASNSTTNQTVNRNQVVNNLNALEDEQNFDLDSFI